MSSITAKSAPNFDIHAIGKIKELRQRIFFVLLGLIVYRIGTYVPIPGIDAQVLQKTVDQNNAGIIGMLNMFSGGALGRMSIFALAIMPYITASIIMQLMTVISPALETLKKDGPAGRRKINQYTRYATVILCILQGYGMAVGVSGDMFSDMGKIVVIPKEVFIFVAVVSLTGGTMFLMWLGEQITTRGIGNGISLIIFAGIVAELPGAAAGAIELARNGEITTIFLIILAILVIAVIALVVFCEKAQRRVIVNYPRRQKGNQVYGGGSTHLPMKLNPSGVIPPIFAGALLSFPITLSGMQNTDGILGDIVRIFNPGGLVYTLVYAALIVFFTFFYTAITFNPVEVADNLKKNGGVVPGYRPGKDTAKYFDFILSRIMVVGAIYLVFVCVLPQILTSRYGIPFYLGGTSLLIVVSVVMDFMTQIQSYLFSQQYDRLIKATKLKK